LKTYTWETIRTERINDRITRQMIIGKNEMVVRWEFAKGALASRHDHPHEQIVMMVSGSLRLVVADAERVLGPGEIVVIPPNVPHEAEALRDTVVIDIFSPPREDFLSGEGVSYLQV
jgi:quercetin dioxygenase-like cupin family protein